MVYFSHASWQHWTLLAVHLVCGKKQNVDNDKTCPLYPTTGMRFDSLTHSGPIGEQPRTTTVKQETNCWSDVK